MAYSIDYHALCLFCVLHMRHAINHLSRPKQKPFWGFHQPLVMAGTRKKKQKPKHDQLLAGR